MNPEEYTAYSDLGNDPIELEQKIYNGIIQTLTDLNLIPESSNNQLLGHKPSTNDAPSLTKEQELEMEAKEKNMSKEMLFALKSRTPLPKTSENLPVPASGPKKLPFMKWGIYLNVERIVKSVPLPKRKSAEAAGYDLFVHSPGVIPAKKQVLVPLGIKIQLPERTYGRIASRSGLASKHGIHVGAGVIDRDYRGEVMVLLYNLSDVDYHYMANDAIAQLIIETYHAPDVEEIANLNDIFGKTIRGDKGFGSTGR